MNTERRSLRIAASPGRSDTTSTGMPSGPSASANACAPGPGRQSRCSEPASRDRSEQRDVREPCAGSVHERGDVVLQRRRRRVQVGVDRAAAQTPATPTRPRRARSTPSSGRARACSRRPPSRGHSPGRRPPEPRRSAGRSREPRRPRRRGRRQVGRPPRRDRAPRSRARPLPGARSACRVGPRLNENRIVDDLRDIPSVCVPTMAVTSSYDALREAIVRGDIAPNARLVEADLSTTFDMSRGAVRTALIRLEQDGLVVREPHRGARVRRVGDDEAVEILQARAVLEGLAVRQAAERIDDAGVATPAGMSRPSTRAARARRPPRGIGRERRPARDPARALRPCDRRAPHPDAERPDRALPVPHDPDPRPLGCVRGRARGDRRGGDRRARRPRPRSRCVRICSTSPTPCSRGLLPGGIDKASRGVL